MIAQPTTTHQSEARNVSSWLALLDSR